MPAARPCRNRRAKSADLESSFYQWVAPRRARQPLDILRESAFQCDTHRCGRMRRAKQARLRPARRLVPLIWLQEIGRKLILLQRTSRWPWRRMRLMVARSTRKMRAISESLLRQYRCRSLARRARRFISWERRYSGPCSRPAEEGADQSVGTSISR